MGMKSLYPGLYIIADVIRWDIPGRRHSKNQHLMTYFLRFQKATWNTRGVQEVPKLAQKVSRFGLLTWVFSRRPKDFLPQESLRFWGDPNSGLPNYNFRPCADCGISKMRKRCWGIKVFDAFGQRGATSLPRYNRGPTLCKGGSAISKSVSYTHLTLPTILLE